MKVLALSGWKQSGKDSVANYLIEKHQFVRFGFADILKDMVAEQYDIPRSHCDDPAFKEKPLKQYPINPKDDFSRMISEFMKEEYRDQNGKRYGAGTTESVMHWTPRALCILEGSIKRSVNSAYWVDRVIKNIHEAEQELNTQNREGFFVISDLRFRSEVDQLREAFGEDLLTVRINRFKDVDSTDPSERDLDNAVLDFTLDNFGTLEDLHKDADQLAFTVGATNESANTGS